MFLLCMAETHGCFTQGVELIARCQERVMLKDKEGLLRELLKLKIIIDRFVHVFQKISVNPNSGENFANPVEVCGLIFSQCTNTDAPEVGTKICKVQCTSFQTCTCTVRPRPTSFPLDGCVHWADEI